MKQTADKKQLILKILLKLYYIPLMGWFFVNLTGELFGGRHEVGTFAGFYVLALNILFFIDVGFGLVGYLLDCKSFLGIKLNAQIRSVNPYWWGWVATLICYPPFNVYAYKVKSVVGLGSTSGASNTNWANWLYGLDEHPLFAVITVSWGFFIIVLLGYYTWSTVVFGARFSNLTNRGIITRGPFRYMKHPAYFFKNLAWWFMFAPFIVGDGVVGKISGCLSLLLTNIIYYIRAKAEEKHLMEDPEYQKYCAWIAKNGWWAQVKSYYLKLTANLTCKK